jgi:hypothetical protein
MFKLFDVMCQHFLGKLRTDQIVVAFAGADIDGFDAELQNHPTISFRAFALCIRDLFLLHMR